MAISPKNQLYYFTEQDLLSLVKVLNSKSAEGLNWFIIKISPIINEFRLLVKLSSVILLKNLN